MTEGGENRREERKWEGFEKEGRRERSMLPVLAR